MTNDPTTPEIFPQHLAGKRRTTIGDIVRQCSKTNQSMGAILALIAAIHPRATKAEIRDALVAEQAHMDEKLAQAEAKTAAAEVMVDEVERDEFAFASLALDPETLAFERDFQVAAEQDPYWDVDDAGVASARRGATYRTPEELVAAYRARLGGHRNG
jgi:hypothetical protein